MVIIGPTLQQCLVAGFTDIVYTTYLSLFPDCLWLKVHTEQRSELISHNPHNSQLQHIYEYFHKNLRDLGTVFVKLPRLLHVVHLKVSDNIASVYGMED